MPSVEQLGEPVGQPRSAKSYTCAIVTSFLVVSAILGAVTGSSTTDNVLTAVSVSSGSAVSGDPTGNRLSAPLTT